ncbi:reprolysin-like metallopeptidase [Pseudoxanthomonas mexicana]
MKLRVGACALMLVLAGCSGESPESGMAGMRGVAASKATGSLPTSLPLARAIGASIANAPDRGALLSFPNKATPAKQEGAYTWFPAAISEAHAFKGIATGEMTVPSPDGSQVKLRYERHVEEIDGNWTWIGRVVGGDPMQEAIITFGEKAVFGSIPQANGKPALSLQTRNGAVFAVQTDPSKVVSATKGHVDMMVPEASALRSSMGAAVSQSAQVSQGATAVAQGAPQTGANTIDVAIGYTPEFAAANNGASGAATRLVYLIQVGNQAFVNSNVNGYLRIVNAVQVSYTNTNTNQTALQELTGSTGQAPVTVPASLAPLRTARDQYGADIAVLVRKFSTPENEGCGIAWLNGANRTAITAADASWGYAVISDGYDQGTDGKTYYCADETLVHEAAHLMGSAHDRANSTAPGPNGTTVLQYGAYPYSFGYKTAAAAGNFYTVMAYGDTGQIDHRIFSTPLKSTCGATGNLACGVANSEDNARSLNQTIPVVAGFRSTLVPFAAVSSDVDGNGYSDLLFARNGEWANYRFASSGFQTSRYGGVSSGGKLVAASKLNGDAYADFVFDTGYSIELWISSAEDTYTKRVAGYYGDGWKYFGAHDMDGDGYDEIVFTQADYVAIWKLSGTSVVGGVYKGGVGAGYYLAAIGNLDGNAAEDLLWTNGSHVIAWAHSGNYGFTIKSLGYYGDGFTIFGIYDLNADGNNDIVFRRSSEMAYWGLSSLTITSGSSLGSAGTGFTLRTAADYNGDGITDFVWSNNSQIKSWSFGPTLQRSERVLGYYGGDGFQIVP